MVDVNLLCDELSNTSLCTDSPVALNDLVKCYNSTLSAALDRHAPLVTKFIAVRPLVPWFSEDIRESRRERRRAERRWRRSRSVHDLLECKKKRNFTTYLMTEACRKFYSDFIAENNSNQRNLFSATKRLLNQGHEVPLPPTSDKLVLANEMGGFFVEKIDAIHVKLDKLADCLHDSHFDYVKTLPTRTLDSFIPLTESAVSKLIGCSPKKSCMFDPMLTTMVISCADVLLPVITKMINLSLRLMINDDKTEFLLVGTRQQLDKLDSCSIIVGNNRISPSPCVRNLGSWFDSNLSMTDHINKACNAAFYYLHNLRRIMKYLSRDSLITLVHAFITSRLDCCNGLLLNLPKVQIAKLQRVQNAAARLILGIRMFSHITLAGTL